MLEFLITGDLAKQVLGLAQRDPKLARTLAQQFVARVDPAAMQQFLLDEVTAIELLAKRLAHDPARTLDQLQRLPLAKRAPRPAKTPAPRAAAASAPRTGRRRRRQQLSAADAAVLKRAILQYVGAHPGANRRGILGAVAIPTDGLYNRLMSELREAGELRVSGARSSMVYTLKRRGAAAPAAAADTKGKTKAAGAPKAKAKGAAPKGKPAAKAKAKAKRGGAAAVTARPGSTPGDARHSATDAS